ncbi:hypothetical protein [Morganella morganii]|nr:hypothetical protein [Morganella morganii]
MYLILLLGITLSFYLLDHFQVRAFTGALIAHTDLVWCHNFATHRASWSE